MNDNAAFRFDLAWRESEPVGPVDRATEGRLCVWIGKNLIWGEERHERLIPVEWSWGDLLEYLAEHWASLVYEEDYPNGLAPVDPRSLRTIAQFQWNIGRKLGTLSDEDVLRQDEEIYEFELRHDLAHATKGLRLPSLMIMRDGGEMILSASSAMARLPARIVTQALETLGGRIADRIRNLGDARAVDLVSAWDKRWPAPSMELIKSTVSVPSSYWEQLVMSGEGVAFWEATADRHELTELQAAARMAAAKLQPLSLRIVLDVIRGLRNRPTDHLDKLSARALEVCSSLKNDTAYEQGYKLARWLREQPETTNPSGIVDPESLLRIWNVILREINVPEQQFEAVGVWGPRHGPAVLINALGRRFHHVQARRAILAHEICHLLIDRDAALPLAEVFEGRLNGSVERRASAFGAELLVPRAMIQAAWRDNLDLEQFICKMAEEYMTSFEVVAWQIWNWKGRSLARRDQEILRSFVSAPSAITVI